MIIAAFIENVFLWGAFAYIGAHLRQRFNLSFTLIGLSVGCFGIGGLIYAGLVKLFVSRLGQVGLATGGGFVIAAGYVTLAAAPVWWLAPAATVAIGLGFYMLHNTLQTNATQMTPQARGTAVAIFSSAIFIGQTIGRLHRLAGDRPVRRGAVVCRQRGCATDPCGLVRSRTAPVPQGSH